VSRDRALLLLRVLAGGVFVAFGAGKFVNHGSELASFKTYGLPAPEVLVIAIGVVELIGGVLLIAGVLTRPAALALAKGEVISLTLAPAELVAMLVLLWAGPGTLSVRRRSATPHGASPNCCADRTGARQATAVSDTS
jgi:putative oxidoreductase